MPISYFWYQNYILLTLFCKLPLVYSSKLCTAIEFLYMISRILSLKIAKFAPESLIRAVRRLFLRQSDEGKQELWWQLILKFMAPSNVYYGHAFFKLLMMVVKCYHLILQGDENTKLVVQPNQS